MKIVILTGSPHKNGTSNTLVDEFIKGASEKILEGKYFISNPKDYRGKWNKLFNNNNPIYIEIGMGKGNFIIKNAIANPNISA